MMDSHFTLKCSSCNEPGNTLYSCETCQEEINCLPEPESSQYSSKKRRKTNHSSKHERFCDGCIILHIKKDHEVKNWKGETPVICSVHKNLHSEFCRTCDVTFCLKCLGDHREHQLGSVEEREKELRKEIFEILTESEMSEKPLQSKLKSSADVSDRDRLVEVVTTETQELQDALIGLIDKNFKNLEQKGDKLVGQVGSLQSEARNLLSLEGCELIRDFRLLKSRSLDCTKKSQDAMSDNLSCGDRCDIAEVVKDLKTIKKRAIEMMLERLFVCESVGSTACASNRAETQSSIAKAQRHSVQRFSSRKYSGSWSFSSCQLITEGGALLIQELKSIAENNIEFGRQLACRPFRKKVKNVFFDQEMLNIFIQSDDDSVDALMQHTGYEAQKLNVRTKNEFICFYIANKEIHECYWNTKKKNIALTHSNKSFECESMPKLISSAIHPFVCLLTDENEVVAYDVTRDDFIFIPFIIHRCESVDYVTTFNGGSQQNSCNFFFWSIKSKSVTLYNFTPNGDCNVQKLHWTNPTQPFTTQLNLFHISYTIQARLTFLPAVQNDCDTSAENLKYVFALYFR